MDSYHVDVARLPVRLVTLSGRSYEAEVFLRQLAVDPEGPQTLGGRLNDAEGFLPCLVRERVELVQLGGIAYFEYTGDLPELERAAELGAGRIAAELELTHGELLRGELVALQPPGRDRLSDLLNAPDDRFLLLDSGARIFYVNRRALLWVHELADG